MDAGQLTERMLARENVANVRKHWVRLVTACNSRCVFCLDTDTPRNPYSAYLQIVFDGDYGLGGVGVPRHQLKTGPQIPVEVVAELDRKTDDGKPYTGAVQFSAYAANGAPEPTEGSPSGCTTALNVAAAWNLPSSSTNCGAATHL